MYPSPREPNGITRCCTAEEALAWLEAITEAALAGDGDAAAIVATAAEHWLQAVTR